MHDWPLRRYEFPMPVRYHLSEAPAAGLVICLHGYQDHALSMLRRVGWWETALPFQILAINGPFPVPVWTSEGFREAYSWYFRDSARNLDFVSPVTTAQRLRQLVFDLGHATTPKVLFGFSQGGYLNPYLAQELTGVRGLIGLGCGYTPEVYAACPSLELHAIHGDLDERVAFGPAREGFERVLLEGRGPAAEGGTPRLKGEFHLVPGLTHRVETRVEPLVRQLALSMLA